MTHQIDRSRESNISISRFGHFIMRNDLLEILPNGSKGLWNVPSIVFPNDLLSGNHQFRQESDAILDLFDLFWIAEDDSELEPDIVDIESNLLEFDDSLKVSTPNLLRPPVKKIKVIAAKSTTNIRNRVYAETWPSEQEQVVWALWNNESRRQL